MVVAERKTGGQAAVRGCEMTVVLPTFYSLCCPPLGGVKEIGFEESLNLWWSWPGVRARAGFWSPPRPRRCRGQCTSCVLQLYCSRQAENFCVGILSARNKKSPAVQEEAGDWKEALPSRKPIPWLLSLISRWAPQSEA